MASKWLPLELLFEIVPFIPTKNATPNSLSSCWLLHKLLLPRVIKWQEIKILDQNRMMRLETQQGYFRLFWNAIDLREIARYEAFVKKLEGNGNEWERIGSVPARNTLDEYTVSFHVAVPTNDEYTFKVVVFDVSGVELFTLPFVTGRLLPS